MAYRIQFLPAADRHLRKLPRKVQGRIANAVAALADDPRPHGVLKMAGRGGEYRIRVGGYRIVYTIDDDRRIVEVGIIADRKDVYRRGR